MNIVTKWSYQPQGGEINNQPSKAIPDQTMSLKQILKRYTSGMPFSAKMHDSIYTDDETATDFTKLDLVDQEEHVYKASAELSEIKQRQTKEAEQKRKKQEENAQETERLRKEIEELKTNSKD